MPGYTGCRQQQHALAVLLQQDIGVRDLRYSKVLRGPQKCALRVVDLRVHSAAEVELGKPRALLGC